jgi:uracil-DNA glycosylase
MASWREQVAPDWAKALAPVEPALAQLGTFLREELAAGHDYLPASEAIMRAFETPLSDVRVLIVGQDPYPTPGDPVGLSFSVPPGRALPRSLQNMARELAADTGEVLASGDLTAWQAQGVMLLNRVLTVRPGLPASHRGKGWEEFTAHAIRVLVDRGGPLVAVLWGRDAGTLRPLLGGVPVIASAHPSPLSATAGFFGSRPFSRANELLVEAGADPVDWRLGTAAIAT